MTVSDLWINDVGAFCVCYSSDCEVILDVKKGILRFTIGHSKFVKHVDVDFIFQVFKSKLFLFTDYKIIDCSAYWSASSSMADTPYKTCSREGSITLCVKLAWVLVREESVTLDWNGYWYGWSPSHSMLDRDGYWCGWGPSHSVVDWVGYCCGRGLSQSEISLSVGMGRSP